jgi:hypothetical protein
MAQDESLPSNNNTRRSGCVILLNGFPGVGKLSTARALCLHLQEAPTRLFDNHLIIDPVEAIHPGRGPEHKFMRAHFRQIAFANLKSLPDQNLMIVMTATLAKNDEDAATFAEYVDIARARDVPFYSFIVTCDPAEHRDRLQSADRLSYRVCKLSDPGKL